MVWMGLWFTGLFGYLSLYVFLTALSPVTARFDRSFIMGGRVVKMVDQSQQLQRAMEVGSCLGNTLQI